MSFIPPLTKFLFVMYSEERWRDGCLHDSYFPVRRTSRDSWIWRLHTSAGAGCINPMSHPFVELKLPAAAPAF